MGETFAGIVTSGPLLLGVAVAVVAGLVSFLSPCILPLVPGYLAYVTGLSGADLDGDRRQRGRVLAGSLLFVAGFGAVFITIGVVAASAGRVFQEHQRALEIAGGVLMLGFALALLGLVPGLQREVRVRRLPAAGMAGAPVFGAVFALSWTPCIGPTIGAVLALGMVAGQPGRAAVLAAGYTLGLGLPFLAFGLGLRWFVGAVAVIRRHPVWVTRAGAALLAVVGVALLTGVWGDLVFWLRGTVGVGEVSL
ncbi:MAG: cytochrome c biogenesis protein CcdA [Micromonosporaceae bacterium]|nr:cytochrome c biogenesis protein CcdA [Micromonosporaceae bacterium]